MVKMFIKKNMEKKNHADKLTARQVILLHWNK